MPETVLYAEVGDQRVRLTNLEKVLYPMAGFTKADVVRYYVSIAPVMLAHLERRCVTLVRFPNGVSEPSFFAKRCPDHRPDWVTTAIGPGNKGEGIEYCELNSVAALAWAANLAGLEIHTPMSRSEDMNLAHLVVFDLDPGDGAGMTECAQVGIHIKSVLDALGLEVLAKTSGSKGMQLYVPLNTGHGFDHTSEFAHAVGQLVAKQHPHLALTEMSRAARQKKVFIDWSQNSRHKTTVCAYSLRAKDYPEVSTPLRWEEVEAAADGYPLGFDPDEVLARVERFGDLFAPAASLMQQLPDFKSGTDTG